VRFFPAGGPEIGPKPQHSKAIRAEMDELVVIVL
jgi:hypothetical protein